MYTRKELNGMFTEGQLVIYGGEGVCRIAAVGPSSLSGTDKTKLYYTLTPLTRSGTVLTPVDTKVLMRPILSRQEAEDFIAQLPQLPPEEPESRSMRLLKEFYQQIVERYLRRAEDALYGELAAALDLPEEEVLPYIRRTCPQWPE